MRRRDFVRGLGLTGVAAGSPLSREADAQTLSGSRAPARLLPQTRAGHATITFDFPELAIGTADYVEGPTGCTVFRFPAPAMVEVDIRGGATGTIGSYDFCDAICLAGGSAMGLEAATGVAAEIFEQRGSSAQAGHVPLVLGAVIYDFVRRTNSIYPDKALGRAALRAAIPGFFPLGRCGAGSSATVGKAWGPTYKGEFAGQGGAATTIGPTHLGVFTVVNALGAIVDRAGTVVRGNLDADGRRASLPEAMASKLPAAAPPAGNTTLTVVVTDQRLPRPHLRQLARQVHASMARAIQPFYGRNDGDVLYAVTTGRVENHALHDFALAAAAGELAWDAVLNCFAPD